MQSADFAMEMTSRYWHRSTDEANLHVVVKPGGKMESGLKHEDEPTTHAVFELIGWDLAKVSQDKCIKLRDTPLINTSMTQIDPNNQEIASANQARVFLS